jgi:small basic protein (TIGR04137 family)
MSLHKSLVSQSSLKRHRSVLTRAERMAKLADEDKWHDGDSVFGLPKVKVRRVKAGAKHKKVEKPKAEGEAEAAEGAAEGAAQEEKPRQEKG